MQESTLPVNLNLNVRGLHQSATLAINEISNRFIKEGREVFKLGLGQSPFPVPESVVESLKQNAFQKDYLPVKGLPELREAIAGFNKKIHNLDCSAENIIIGPGSKELIFILQLVYYGDLIISTPSWVSYSPQARIIGRNVTWVPTAAKDDYRLTPEKLDVICRTDPDRPRIVILNYPSNPTGSTYPLHRLEKLAQVARQYKVILVSDEIYGLLQFDAKHVSIAHFYPEGTIVSNGLSKWCGAGGWRLGYFTFPPNLKWLLNAMATVASETFTATSAPIQYAGVTAFNGNSEIDNYLVQSRRILSALGKYSENRLNSLNISLPTPQGAFYLFPDFSYYSEKLKAQEIFTSVELCNIIMQQTGVAFLPGSDFGRQPEELTARIAFVDFDGKNTLNAAQNEYENNDIDEAFLKKYCPKIYRAFDKLQEWLEAL